MDPANTPAPVAPTAPPPDVAVADSTPFMDIVVRQAPAVADEAATSVPRVAPDDPTAPQNVTAKPPAQAAKQPRLTSPAKPQGSGVGFAIAATVVIIVSLAGLAVYAYLQA